MLSPQEDCDVLILVLMDNQNTCMRTATMKMSSVLILVLMDNQNTPTSLCLHLEAVLILVLMDNQNTKTGSGRMTRFLS